MPGQPIHPLSETEVVSGRLRLTPISHDFEQEIFREFTPQVTTFMYPKSADTIDDTRKFIKESLEQLGSGTYLTTVITDKQTGEFLGIAALCHIDTANPELGIWIKVSAWGNLFGREAITALKEWADDNLAYEHLKYPVDRGNVPSRKIPESLGGVIEDEYEVTSESGNKLELVEYRIYPRKKKDPNKSKMGT